jgi:hypothetical protein
MENFKKINEINFELLKIHNKIPNHFFARFLIIAFIITFFLIGVTFFCYLLLLLLFIY